MPLNHYFKTLTNPKNDLAVVFAICHRMIHRRKGLTLTIEELNGKINNIA